MDSQRRAHSGRITIHEQEARKRRHQVEAAIKTSLYVWHPSPEVAADLPPDFSLSFDCLVAKDRVRRFVPHPIEKFLLEAALSGSALMAHGVGLGAEQRFAYRAMRLIYQLGPHLREYFSRSFKQETDLYLPRSSRIGDTHILPEGLGLDAHGQGKALRPKELMEQGREAARTQGNRNVDSATCIRLGLLEAARRNPLGLQCVSEAEALRIVRLGLFDLGPTTAIEAQVEVVIDQLLGALKKHLKDDTQTFDRWFFHETNNLVHQIAKKKRLGLNREVVRKAVLETVFRAYRYMGDCIHVQMAHFRQALPKKLTARERAWYDSLYQKQPVLGGLPLILLRERFDFLKEAILKILDDPQDKRHFGVLLRLLQYYGEMVSKKREGDRRYKAQKSTPTASPDQYRFRAAGPSLEPATEERNDLFAEITGHVRELKQSVCACRKAGLWRAELVGKTATEILWNDICERCLHTQPRSLSREEFEEIGLQLLRDRGDRAG